MLVSTLLWSFRFVAVICGGLLVFNADFVRLWVGSAMFSGHQVNRLIVAVFATGVISVVGSNTCYALGDITANSLIQSAISFCLLAAAYPCLLLGGLKGLLIGQCVCIVGFSLAYYPIRIARLVRLNKYEKRSLLSGIACAAAAATAAAFLFSGVNSPGWAQLAANGCYYCAVYLVVLLLLCSTLRLEIISGTRMARAFLLRKARFAN